MDVDEDSLGGPAPPPGGPAPPPGGPAPPPGGPAPPPGGPAPPPGGPAVPPGVPAPPPRQPDPDALPPRHQAAMFGVILSLARRYSNKQNRWIARGGGPNGVHHPNNPSWGRVVNKFQLIEKFTDRQHKECFFLSKQDLYQFRDDYIYPMLNQRMAGAMAQGPHAAAASLPRGLTPDAMAALFMLKVHHDPSYRLLGSVFGIDSSQAQRWVTRLRTYIFEHDPVLRRNRNLTNPVNLEALLEEAHRATLQDERVVGLYSHLCPPRSRLAVMGIDSRAVKVQKSSDYGLQHRSYSTKIKNNSVQKMSISTMESKCLITFPLMVSTSPAGTDESSCEHLIVLEESGVVGGLRTLLMAQTPANRPQYTVVLLGM